MSNIYIQEPPTSGKVLLKTSVGDIDIELWTKECPKACRNFMQLCMENYYNGTIFHRVVKDFIVQGGDPNGDGTGGISIYGDNFKDEFHSRLRYTRRGLVGMANAGPDDNGSQFFFTMAPTPELQNKNTLFGKVTGDTVFNMLKLEEGLVDHNERPLYPQKIIRAEILNNPFNDIQPRIIKTKLKKEKKKIHEKGVKNFGLLSFGKEAEADEEETNEFVQMNAGKAKSMHDVIDDPKLSKEVIQILKTSPCDNHLEGDNSVRIKEENEDMVNCIGKIKNKLKTKDSCSLKNYDKSELLEKEQKSSSSDDELYFYDEEKTKSNANKRNKIRQEIQLLKKQYQNEKKMKDELLEKKIKKEDEISFNTTAIKNEIIESFIEEKVKYSNLRSKIPKKGANREDFTLELLKKFRNKLDSIKSSNGNLNNKDVSDENLIEKEIHGDEWLAHTLSFQSMAPVLAKDASTKSDDWYDVYDPRNPLNKRKRGEANAQQSLKTKKR